MCVCVCVCVCVCMCVRVRVRVCVCVYAYVHQVLVLYCPLSTCPGCSQSVHLSLHNGSHYVHEGELGWKGGEGRGWIE